jgi:hypothetical protein
MENSVRMQALSMALRFSNTSEIEKCVVELIDDSVSILHKYDIRFEDAWNTWMKKAYHKKYT